MHYKFTMHFKYMIIPLLGKEMISNQESECQRYLDHVNGNVKGSYKI